MSKHFPHKINAGYLASHHPLCNSHKPFYFCIPFVFVCLLGFLLISLVQFMKFSIVGMNVVSKPKLDNFDFFL